MQKKQDYYEVLEVSQNASDVDIKKSYRRMAMKYHPDRNPGDKSAEEKFKTVQQAYEVLSDPQKRKVYDAYGHAGVDASSGYGGGAGGFHGEHQGGASFEDVFGSIFGDVFGHAGDSRGFNRGGQSQVKKGSDLRYIADLSLEDAIHGTNITIKVNIPVGCKGCNGSGAKDGAKPTACGTCHGQGQVRIQQGFFSIQQTCPACGGAGTVITDYCKKCRGTGRAEESKTLSVKIPAGVDNGDKIRLSGEGEAGFRGGKAGDLYVQVRVKEHAIFKRENSDLYCKIPISFALAAVGGEADVPTFSGPVKLKIPAETQTGKVFRLRGKGVTTIRKEGPGDLFCEVTIETPVNLNKEQKELLQKFDESVSSNNKHNPLTQSWVQMVKNLFREF
jgi:molecular chaperone DnaJ